MRKLPLKVLGVFALFFAIACGCGEGFKQGFDQGLNSSAAEGLAEAAGHVATCAADENQARLAQITSDALSSLTDGTLDGFNAALISGMITGVAEDGTCTAEDVMIVEDAWSGMAP